MQEMVNMEVVDTLLGYVRHSSYLNESEGELYFHSHELNPLLPSFEKPFYYKPADGFMMTLTQALAYEKALFFGQNERAESLVDVPLLTDEASQAYRGVSGEEFLWRQEYPTFLDKVLWERYSNDPELREMLILTDPFALSYVSRLDQTLGLIGDLSDVRMGDTLVRGQNLLGEGLLAVRERLLKEYIPVLRQTAKDIIPDPERSTTVGGTETKSEHGPAPFKHPVRDFVVSEVELESEVDLGPEFEQAPDTEDPRRDEPTLNAKDVYQDIDLNVEGEELPQEGEFVQEDKPNDNKKQSRRPNVEASEKSANEVYQEEQAQRKAQEEKIMHEHDVNQDLLQTVDDEIMEKAIQERERQQRQVDQGKELGR